MTRRGLLSSLLASGLAPAAEPDLANLFPLLEANSHGQRRTLGFLDPRWKKLDAWKKEARPELIRLFRYNPAAVPLSAKVEGSERRDGFRIERVTISATAQHSIPGWRPYSREAARGQARPHRHSLP